MTTTMTKEDMYNHAMALASSLSRLGIPADNHYFSVDLEARSGKPMFMVTIRDAADGPIKWAYAVGHVTDAERVSFLRGFAAALHAWNAMPNDEREAIYQRHRPEPVGFVTSLMSKGFKIKATVEG